MRLFYALLLAVISANGQTYKEGQLRFDGLYETDVYMDDGDPTQDAAPTTLLILAAYACN